MKVFKIFFTDLDKQESWINEKAKLGWRLIKTTKLFYFFEKCEPFEYQYRIEYIYDKSYEDIISYIDFLKELNIRSIKKSFSAGVYAPLKLSAGITGQIRTSSGTINSEIFILEKKNDGNPFEIHTTKNDKINYYKKVRNINLWPLIILPILIIIIFNIGGVRISGRYITPSEWPDFVYIIRSVIIILITLICIPLLINVIKSSKKIKSLKNDNFD